MLKTKFRSMFCLAACWLAGGAGGATYPLYAPDQELVGTPVQVPLKYEDTFARVAREFDVGFQALQRANPGVDEWLPGSDTQLTVPLQMILPRAERTGIVINLSEMRLFYYHEDEPRVDVFPIGIGSEGRETPIMVTRTVSKLSQPTWYPTPSIRARHAANGRILPAQVPPGPDNPLGSFAIKLAEDGYFIHGTNSPFGVGQRVSAGCIRMYEPDIKRLVEQVANGTAVRVVRQPFKAGWQDGKLYLEAHRLDEDEPREYSAAVAAIVAATAQRPAKVDWDLVMATARAATGLPTAVAH